MLRKIARAGFVERTHGLGEVTMNYAVGPSNGPPLLLIPAQMATWETYVPVLPTLARWFSIYVVDVRGHGLSSWTPGHYNWNTVGGDLARFLEEVVRRPAIVSGNSSGGILALWLAANAPQQVAGIVIEDAPLFSLEMPRFRDRDRFVYNGLKHLVAQLGDVENRDLADYFRGTELPVSETRTKRMPAWLVNWLSKVIERWRQKHPGQRVVDIVWFPWPLRLLFKSLSTFDPDFARAFVDGRFYEGIDHADALCRARCPILLLHANWMRLPDRGLIGAMDEDDANRARMLAPQLIYKKIKANHVIHSRNPKAFLREMRSFGGAVFPSTFGR
jgi:pimeloyl-ACP methyl ester carboxylesterase